MTPGAAGTASYRTRGETVAQDETDAAARLAGVLAPLLGGSLGPAPMEYATNIAIALLPVVRELGDLRAAEELRAAAVAARGMHDPPAPDCVEWADWLDARAAAALRGEAGR